MALRICVLCVMVSPSAYTISRPIPNSRAAASAEAACWIWKSLSLMISEMRNRSFFTSGRPQVAPYRSLSAYCHDTAQLPGCAGKHSFGYILSSPVPAKYSIQTGEPERAGLWSARIRYNLLRSPLHSLSLVVVFFPVPPSTRQAAGPLTENLPHVCLSDRKPVDLSLESPSPRGTMRRLSTRVLPSAPAVLGIIMAFLVACRALERRNGLRASAKRSAVRTTANRLTTKRGNLA